MDRLGEPPRVVEICRLRLHPEQVRERRGRQGFRDGVGKAATHLVVAFRRSGELSAPVDVDVQLLSPLPGSRERRCPGECPPLIRGQVEAVALVGTKLEHFGNRVTVGVEPGFVLPRFEELRGQLVQHVVGRRVTAGVGIDLLLHEGQQTHALEPRVSVFILRIGHGVQ